MEDAMLLYVYWASLCLGLMALATEPHRQNKTIPAEQYVRRAKATRGTAKTSIRAAGGK
jgi:hypothetical protein